MIIVSVDHNGENESYLVDKQGDVSRRESQFGTKIHMNPKEEFGEPKVDHSKADLYTMADEKGPPGLSVVPINSFPDGSDQTSPVTPIPRSTPSQILQYCPSASSGDAMLSAINYNESEILHDGAFDVSVAASLPNLDDGILSNMGSQNTGTSFDLFDGEGNVNDSYEMEGLSPQPFSDPASGLVGSGNLVIDSDSLGSIADQSKLLDSSKHKKKIKQPKNLQLQQQGSPVRMSMMQCPTCNKGFNNSSALAKHRLTHSDERKYVCNLCQKAFKRQDHLNGHLMTHREKKPYECTVENCQKSYCDARSLRRHLENHHNQSLEQIQEAIAKVASNAAAVIAAAAASNTASIRASAANQTNLIGSSQASGSIASVSVVSNQADSVDGTSVGDNNGFSSSHFSNSSTPVTSPTYGAQQQPFFPFEQQKQQHDIDLQAQQQIPLTLGHDAEALSTAISIRPRITLQHHGQLQQQHKPEPPWQETFQAYKQSTVGEQQSNSQSPTNGDQSPNYLGQVSPISPVPTTNLTIIPPQTVSNSSGPVLAFHTAPSLNMDKTNEEPKPIVCTICDRRFKNIQALNGHMRLHGGYFKKEPKDDKKGKKVASNHDMAPPPSMVPKNSKSSSLSTVTQSFQMSLDQVGSPPQAHVAGPYSGHLQSPVAQVAPESPVSESAPVAQVILQTFPQQQEQQMQLQQQQQREQQLQQQLQQQIKLEQQQINQHLEKEQLIQHEQQLQQQLQQQIQQLQMEQQQLQQHFQQQISKEQQTLEQQNQIQLIQQNSQSESVPQSPQIAHSPQLQRQVSVESADYDYQHPPMSQQTLPSHMLSENTASHLTNQDIPANMAAQIHLQQLAQRQEQHRRINQHQQIELNLHPEHATAEPTPSQASLSSIQHTPPSENLNTGTIQSNLQSVFAQGHMPQFSLQNTHIKQEVPSVSTQASFVNPRHLSASQVTLGTSTANQAMTVVQLLNSIENSDFNIPNTLPVSLNCTEQNAGYMKSDIPNTEHQCASPSSAFSNSVKHDILDILNNKSHNLDLNTTFNDVDLSKHDIFDQISASKQSKAAESNPFSFPNMDYDSSQFSRKDNADSDTIQNRHKELKRRLSLGNDHEYKSLNCVLPNNLTGFLPKDTAFVKPSQSISNHNSSKPENRPRMRSKSGDDYKLMRSQSVDHTFMRPRSRTEASLWKYKSHNSWDNGQVLSKSDGAGQFRNPNMLGGTLKHRRKHRPAPLFIPPHMSSGVFQSRLRSPRIIHGGEGKGNTPPPYTPPPMLSPIRSGSGLFCSITGYKPVTPKSAPITPRSLLLSHRSSISSLKQESVEEITEETTADLEEESPPETDVQPHVNVGPQYQAEIPPINDRKSDAKKTVSKEDILWKPSSRGDASDDEVQYYQDFACSAALWGNGCNVEYALHLLHLMKGNIQAAMLKLMEGKVSLPSNHTLLNYTYQECDSWSVEEIEKFQQALWKCDKDFLKISKEVGTKSTKECIQQYYLWKKVCPEEHKRLRIIRRKREQDRLYNLRSQQQQQQQQIQQQQQQPKMEDMDVDELDSVSSEEGDDQNDRDDVSVSSSVSASPAPAYTCDYPECNASFPSKQGLNGHARIHGGQNNKGIPPVEGRGPGRPHKPQASANRITVLDESGGESFPCKLCGRVFSKVKSRSAHMKSHRMAENDKNKNKNNYEISVNKLQRSPNR